MLTYLAPILTILAKTTSVNYPTTKDDWASCFTAICLLLPKEVRSLTIAPHVYSQVPYEVLMSYTDYANIQNLFLIVKWSLTSHRAYRHQWVLRSVI